MFYFAYGSNLSYRRLEERGINWLTRKKGVLKGYKFIINKKSQKNPNIGFANIIKDENSQVEGLIYEISDEDILKLDKFEGVTTGHYRRENHNINGYDCAVYIANDEWTSESELLTSEEYKNYILEGKMFLSKEYSSKLLEIKTI